MKQLKLLLIVVSAWFAVIHCKIACKNRENKDVDWFIIYKSPDIDKNPNILVQNGSAFFYMDSTTGGRWTLSDVGVTSGDQPFAYTLQQIYDSKRTDETFHVLYNDEWPEEFDVNGPQNKGHCKGSMLFDQKTGFWLIHSIPKFPPKNQYGYPASGTRYGQTALCITFGYPSLRDIAEQLIFYDPSIYSSSLPTKIATEVPILTQVLRGKSKTKAPFNQIKTLSSLNGVSFTNFAKTRKWNKELYYEFVAPSLKSSLLTETWQNGGGDLLSNCTSQYTVNNIDSVNLGAKIKFRDTKDHSKWAISTTDNRQDVCIGDINRQRGQFKRSGGTMCFKDGAVWRAFRDMVDRIQDCPIHALSHDPGVRI